MSYDTSSSQPPVNQQFGNIETAGGSKSFAGYAEQVNFQSDRDRLDTLPRAEGASFDSGELEHERLCLPGTRTEILEQIVQWTTDPQGKRIFWLSGMAGTGKSAIARTLAHNLSERKQLGASFFFSRGRGDRGNASKFFTSIAYKLAFWDTENRGLAPLIRKAFDQYPDITERAKREQWKHLIQEPLSQMEGCFAHGTILVFVIDALDECEDDRDVRLILRILFEATGYDHIQFRVFMTGRPSASVQHDAFLGIDYRPLVLHEIERHIVQQDLRIFFEYELRSIKEKHRLIGDFPGKDELEILVQRTGELFIYATTICRFIGERAHPPPRKRLEMILQNNSSSISALKNLDQLYIQILQEAVPMTDSAQDKAEFCSYFKVFIGAILGLFSSLSVTSLAALLSADLDDIHLTLDSLGAILNIPQKNNATVSLLHPSFRDFLLDKARCTDPDFWVDSARTHVTLTERCLSLMAASLKRDICELKLPGTLTEEIDPGKVREKIPAELEYACTYWVRHLESCLQAPSSISISDLLHRTLRFLEQNILYWFEALSLLGKMHESVLMLATISALAQSYNNIQLVDLVHDAYRFSLEHRLIIELAPLQTYHAALMFSPSTSVLRNLFESQIPCWIKCVSEVEYDWGSSLQTLEGHTSLVTSVTFSPDGQKLASASYDSARIWDAATGTPLQALQGYDNGFWGCLVFSLDGQRIAFLSGIPGTVRVWDVVFGSLLQTFENNVPKDSIRSIALSPDGQYIVFGYRDGMIAIRDITFGSLLKTFEGHCYMTSVVFSPNGQKLASASENSDGAICVWDVASGSRLQIAEGNFTSVVFSPDGHKLASGSANGTIHIWDAESGPLLQTYRDHEYSITWITFLYNGRSLASRSMNGIVRVWNTSSGLLLQKWHCHGHGRAVAISPVGQKLASGRYDHTVGIWDIAFGSSVQTLRGHHDRIQLMMFSPDGQKLASVSGDRVCIWDLATGSLMQVLEGHTESTSSITFSPDGEKLAYVSKDISDIFGVGNIFGGRVRLWNAVLGLRKLEHHDHYITSVTFSPDGQKLALLSCNYITYVWNAVSGLPLRRVAGDYDWVRSSAISPVSLRDTQPEGLSVVGRWVTMNEKKIVWLPQNRQASKFVTYGTKIAIGSTAGVVTILDLDFKQMDPYLMSSSNFPDRNGTDVDSDWGIEQES